jgi:hypothetical protein
MSNDPIVPPLDGTMEIDTAMGRLPLWKAKALMIGRIQHVINDAAAAAHCDQPQTTRADPEDEPPPLAADASFTGGGFGKSPATVNVKAQRKDADPDEERERAQLMAELLDKLNADIEALDARLTAYEDRCAAEARSSEALNLAEGLAETNPDALSAMLEPLSKMPGERRYH